MSTEVLALGVSIIIALIGAISTQVSTRRLSRRQDTVDKKTLDLEEREQARSITNDVIANLRAEVERLKGLVAELHIALEKEQGDNILLKEEVNRLTTIVNSLHSKVIVLQRELDQERAGRRGGS